MFGNHTAPHEFTETFSCEMQKEPCDPRLAGKSHPRYEPLLRLVWWKCVPRSVGRLGSDPYSPRGRRWPQAGRGACRPATHRNPGWNQRSGKVNLRVSCRWSWIGLTAFRWAPQPSPLEVVSSVKGPPGAIRSIGPGRHGWELDSEVHVVPTLWSWWVNGLHVTRIAVGRYRTTLISPSCLGDSPKSPWSGISNSIPVR